MTARSKVTELYAELGTWQAVGRLLSAQLTPPGNPRSLAAMANHCANGSRPSKTLLRALGLEKNRYRRCIEFETKEDAQAHDLMLAQMGMSFAEFYWTAVSLIVDRF